MAAKCPNPSCDGESFIMQPLKVAKFSAKLAAITCVKCDKIVAILDTQANQEVYTKTQSILDALHSEK